MDYFSVVKLSFKDFFRLPELIFLLIMPLIPFGVLTLILINSWLLHVWLRGGNGGQTSSGRRAQVIVTVGAWLALAYLLYMLRGVGAASAENERHIAQEQGLTAIADGYLNIFMTMTAAGRYAVPMILSLGVFLLAQFSFWVVGVRRLWRTRKLVRAK